MAATYPLNDFPQAAAPFIGRHPAAARARIEMIERVMERAIVIPGLRKPVGLHAVLGLLPVAGDLVAGAIGVWLVVEASSLGLPKWKLARMLLNVGIDTTLGAVPIAGEVFDYIFRSNTLNLKIIKKHLDRHHPSTAIIDAR